MHRRQPLRRAPLGTVCVLGLMVARHSAASVVEPMDGLLRAVFAAAEEGTANKVNSVARGTNVSHERRIESVQMDVRSASKDTCARTTGSGKCESVSGSSSTYSGSGTTYGGGRKAPISDSCLIVGETKRVGGSMGECTKKDGSKNYWHFTWLKSTMAEGCPKEIEFDYLDSDTDEVEKWTTPFNVQICGGGPLVVETVK